jgi:hypothetical protein
MAGNALARYAQAGGSPYDEEDYMQMPGQSGANRFLNDRLGAKYGQNMRDFLVNHRYLTGYENGSAFGPQGGTDMDMMQIYGPEDQVAYDSIGRPIPLNDPRHPRNQTPGNALAYPQRR